VNYSDSKIARIAKLLKTSNSLQKEERQDSKAKYQQRADIMMRNRVRKRSRMMEDQR
jgi:hypothetical protein